MNLALDLSGLHTSQANLNMSLGNFKPSSTSAVFDRSKTPGNNLHRSTFGVESLKVNYEPIKMVNLDQNTYSKKQEKTNEISELVKKVPIDMINANTEHHRPRSQLKQPTKFG